MQLNLQIVTNRQACFPGLEWWSAKFGDGDVAYQAVLDALAEEDRVDWARWLMNALGADVNSQGQLLEIRNGNAFFAGDFIDDFPVTIRGSLLVAGKCEADDISAEQVVVGQSLLARSLVILGNVTAISGDIRAMAITAENVRAGGSIVAQRINVEGGTVRAVLDIQCPDMKAASVVPYSTGLKPATVRGR